jgi:hypothetical protein
VRRPLVRHVVAAGVALVAAVALTLAAFGPDDTDPNDVLDSAVGDAVEAWRGGDGPEGVARVFRGYEQRLDHSARALLVEAGLDEIDTGELGPEYVEAADQDDAATAAFVGFVGIVRRAASAQRVAPDSGGYETGATPRLGDRSG